MPEIGVIYDNKYELIRALGEGGFSKTFLGEDIETKEKVVLKFPEITQLGDPAVYERFKREINIGKLLNHPDLPIALTYSEGNPPFLVLKYVDGESLAEVMGKKGCFNVNEVIELCANLLDVLHYCHEKGIYHRDIKPENIVLGSDGRLKIIDFGIAGMEGAPRVTFRGFSTLMGTPEYMSPEQIKGERGGPKSDLYAIGCLMYYLISGKPPFTGDNPLTVMYQHMTSDPVALNEVCEDVSVNLWAVILRSLRRRKDERYETASDMAEALRHLENADLTILKRPDPPLQSVATTKKTSWYLLFGGIIIVISLLIAVIILK